MPDRLRGAFGLRLGLWYALLFIAGSTLLTVLTYALLSKSLAEEENADQLLNQIGRSLMSVAKMPDAVEQTAEEA